LERLLKVKFELKEKFNFLIYGINSFKENRIFYELFSDLFKFRLESKTEVLQILDLFVDDLFLFKINMLSAEVEYFVSTREQRVLKRYFLL